MILRPVEDADVKPLATLWYHGWQLGHAEGAPKELTALRTLQSFEDRIRETLPACFVAGPNGAPNAFIRILETELNQFYIDHNVVGQGLGKRLMQAAEAKLKSLGVPHPHLNCFEGNQRAAGFYTAMGWTHSGVIEEDVETNSGPFTVRVLRFEKSL